MAPELSSKNRDMVVAYQFANIVAGVLTTVVVGALLVGAIVGPALPSIGVTDKAIYFWYMATLLVVGSRLWLLKTFRDSVPKAQEVSQVLYRFRVAAGLAGVCWGILGATSVFVQNETYLVLLLVVGAMGVAAIPYLAADLWSYALFFGGCVLPILFAEIINWSDHIVLTLPLIFVYSAGVASSARKYSKLIRSSFDLKIAADTLNDKVVESNRRLEDELAHRKEVARQLQRARNAAESANREKTMFLSRMSHELRTPLNAVLGFTELLSIMPLHELAEKRDEYLGKIGSSGSHLLSLIEDILDITRIDNGQLKFQEEEFAVLGVVSECMTMLESKAREQSVVVSSDPEADASIVISTDRLRFRQILINLMSNAIKYNVPHGTVQVSFSKSKSRIQVSVSDTGIGIAKQDLEKAFEPFARLRSESGTIEGTGIGLTITKQLTELMKGEISISSEVGQGTTVKVDFPMVLAVDNAFLATGT